jgi:hypothetical protein
MSALHRIGQDNHTFSIVLSSFVASPSRNAWMEPLTESAAQAFLAWHSSLFSVIGQISQVRRLLPSVYLLRTVQTPI